MKLGSFTIDFKFQLILLVFIAIAINANTLFNEYVLDDAIVISDNQFVAKGIHGIPEIITQSYFKGYKKLENLEFSGGRYRPFALVIFALEYQFFGANPVVSHLINVLLFALLIVSLFYLLQKHITGVTVYVTVPCAVATPSVNVCAIVVPPAVTLLCPVIDPVAPAVQL